MMFERMVKQNSDDPKIWCNYGIVLGMAARPADAVDKFTVKRSELPEDNSKVVVLKMS